MVKEWDFPDLISPEEFKTQYLDPLKRAVDNFCPLLYTGGNPI